MRRPLASLLGRPNPTNPGDAADLSKRRVMVGRASVPQVEIDQASVDFRPPLVVKLKLPDGPANAILKRRIFGKRNINLKGYA